jgi:UPF0755 protein
MRSKSTSCLTSVLLLGLTLLCLATLFAWAGLFYLPEQAAQTFGPPSTQLGPLQVAQLSTRLLMNSNDLLLPQDPYAQPRPFRVQLGESTYAISERLQDQGLIANAQAFRTYLVYAGLDTSLQAGEYTLSASQPPLEIAQTMQDATPTEVSFHILPGWRREEIAAALPTSGLSIRAEDFLAASAGWPVAAYPPLESLPPEATAEGFLLPDTYRLKRDLNLNDFLAALLGNFDARVEPEMRQGFGRQGLTLYEAVTLASLVEREAVVDEEMPLIASVFYNRLATGMKLDSDPTVQYALGYSPAWNGWWKSPLSLEDLQVQSAYNTYQIAGLPPGPIANPSLDALQAVAFPADTPYYYFRAACDGSGRHVFAETFEQHLQNACQ